MCVCVCVCVCGVYIVHQHIVGGPCICGGVCAYVVVCVSCVVRVRADTAAAGLGQRRLEEDCAHVPAQLQLGRPRPEPLGGESRRPLQQPRGHHGIHLQGIALN